MSGGARVRVARARRRLTEARREHRLPGVALEVVRLAGKTAALPLAAATEILFDLRFGVRTRGIVDHEATLAPRSVGGDPVLYQPLHLYPWHRALANIPLDPRRTTFIDLGAGRGRALVLAAERGYRRIIGVELDERLVLAAEDNLRRWWARRRRRHPVAPEITVVQADAATYRFPGGPIMMWLYNPFGATTMRQVLRNLCDRPSTGGPVFVAYLVPRHASVFDGFPQLVRCAEGRKWVVYALRPTEVLA